MSLQVQLTNDLTQRITSGGLWGIGVRFGWILFRRSTKNELANLKTELLALGFSKRAIATAFKDVQEAARLFAEKMRTKSMSQPIAQAA